MIGFTFRNTHSDSLNVIAKNVDRSLIPSLRKNEFTIPGRHGTVDYELNTYDKRMIRVEIGAFDNEDDNSLRLNARQIAKWLSGKGMLIFDDEPDKAYVASIYSSVGLQSYNEEDYIADPLPAGIMQVMFECQPFAESLQYNQVNQNITQNAVSIPINIDGTAEAPCIITIKNNGLNTINNITITRKAAI